LYRYTEVLYGAEGQQNPNTARAAKKRVKAATTRSGAGGGGDDGEGSDFEWEDDAE
jgi:hypothetical protein